MEWCWHEFQANHPSCIARDCIDLSASLRHLEVRMSHYPISCIAASKLEPGCQVSWVFGGIVNEVTTSVSNPAAAGVALDGAEPGDRVMCTMWISWIPKPRPDITDEEWNVFLKYILDAPPLYFEPTKPKQSLCQRICNWMAA